MIKLLCIITAFIVTLILTPWFISYHKKIGLLVKDQNKKDKILIPVSGGLAVYSGILGAIITYMFFQTFIIKNLSLNGTLTTSLITITLVSIIGFLDDLAIKKDHNSTEGLSQLQKPVLCCLLSVPLMIMNYGNTLINIPFTGPINCGFLYPIVCVPFFVTYLPNIINLLAGFNGLETGMGIIYMGMLSCYSYFNNSEKALPFEEESVSISRRINKNGVSTYRINGKDLRDMFILLEPEIRLRL